MEENQGGVCVACGSAVPALNDEGQCENCAPSAEGAGDSPEQSEESSADASSDA